MVTESVVPIPLGESHLRGQLADLWNHEFLSPDAPMLTETLWSLQDAAPRVTYELGRILQPHYPTQVRQPLARATGEMASWLVANGARTTLVLTVAYSRTRAVVMLYDEGHTRPDLHSCRADVALIYRVLGHGVVRWTCNVPGDFRVTHLYYDPAPEAPTPQEPQ